MTTTAAAPPPPPLVLTKASTTVLHDFVAHPIQVNCVALAPQTHRLVASGGDDQRVNVWRVDNAANVAALPGHTSPVTCLAVDPAQERLVASGSEGGSVKLFDVGAGKLARSLSGHGAAVTCVNWDATAGLLVSGSMDTSFKVWDLRQKKCIMMHKGHSTEVTDAKVSPDGRWVCSAGTDGVMNLFDLGDRETIYTFELDTKEGKPSPILHFSFHPTAARVATATADRVVRLWDTETFALVASSPQVLPGETHPVRAMAFDGEGHLFTATEKCLRVLDDVKLEVQGTTEAPWAKVAALSHHNGQLLAGAVKQNVVSLYRTEVRAPTGSDRAGSSMPPPAAPVAEADAAQPAQQHVDVVDTPSRLTRSMARRASLLSPLPPAGLPTAKDPEPAAPGPQQQPAAPAAAALKPKAVTPSQMPAAGKSSSTTTSKTPANKNDKENQGSSSEAAPTTTASSNRSEAKKPTTTKEDLPLDPQARLSRADDEVIAGTLLHRKMLTGALTTRLAQLQQLSELWKKGKVPETLSLLHRLFQATPDDQGRLTVLADFLQQVDLPASAQECGPLTLEAAVPLLPVIASLLKLDFEGHVLAGLKTMTALLTLFAADVKDILRLPVSGVDLSREARVEKCKAFDQAMKGTQGRLAQLAKSRAFKPASPVHEAVRRAQAELKGYVTA